MKRVRVGEEGREIRERTMDVLMLLPPGGHAEEVGCPGMGVAAPEYRPSGRVFECKTCNRRFPTFQALGGHRTSHRKPKLPGEGLDLRRSACTKPKVHECSVCGLEFAIGQALGGHMRRHKGQSEVVTSHERSTERRSVVEAGLPCLDLNLPPMEEEIGFLTLGSGVL